jgi:hypothetical protein
MGNLIKSDKKYQERSKEINLIRIDFLNKLKVFIKNGEEIDDFDLISS